MRCMTAICPVGPPKLMSATRSQTRNASWMDTPWRASGLPLGTRAISATAKLLHVRGGTHADDNGSRSSAQHSKKIDRKNGGWLLIHFRTSNVALLMRLL